MSATQTPFDRIRSGGNEAAYGQPHRLGASIALILFALFALALAHAPAAFAAKQVDDYVGGVATGGANATGGIFASAENGVAVNETGAGAADEGDFYVIDAFNNRVQQFTATGEFIRAWGFDVIQAAGPPPNSNGTGFEICDVTTDPANTPAQCKGGVAGPAAGQLGSNGARGIAVDQETGNVFVADGANRRVNVYGAAGEFQGAFGWGVDTGVAELEFCTTASTCVAPNTANGSDDGGQLGAVGNLQPIGIAVAPEDAPNAGNVVLGDTGNRRVQEFSLTLNGLDQVTDAEFVRTLGWDVEPGGTPGFEQCTSGAVGGCQAGQLGSGNNNPGQFNTAAAGFGLSLGVDSAGSTYVADPGNNRVQKIDPTGSSATAFAPAQLSGSPAAASIAVSSQDRVFVHKPSTSPNQIRIAEFEDDGTPVELGHLDQAGLTSGSNSKAIAINGTSGRLYATFAGPTELGSGTYALAFIADDDGASAPGAEVNPPADVGPHGAELSGVVDSNGGQSSWRIEVSKTGVEGSWEAIGSGAAAGSDPTAVSSVAAGLEANTFYRFRIQAHKAFGGGDVISSELTFLTDTVAPEVETLPLRHRADTSAYLVGRVNPNKLATTYRFDYGLTTAYGSSIPAPQGSAGSGGQTLEVGELATGLLPSHTYQYRLCATNVEGTVCGANRSFRTRASIPTPVGRAYEMVTPPDKNNRRGSDSGSIDMLGQESLLNNGGQPSPDGDSVFFSLMFGILDGEAGTAFPHALDRVVIRREDERWRAEAVNNIPAALGAGSNVLESIQAASADLNTQAWHHRTPLFESGSSLSTRVFGDTGGLLGSGFYDWLGPDFASEFTGPGAEAALIDDEGRRMLRWGTYIGLDGPGDVSADQYAPVPAGCIADPGVACSQFPGGRALYLQSPPGSGPRELVSECTGSGPSATQIPMRSENGTPFPTFADDTIAEQPCAEGATTSRRGAVGGGPNGATNAMSEDGRRIFFTSPDGGPNTSACASVVTGPPVGGATGADTDCPPQLYVRQYDSDGNATVRWISRPEALGGPIANLSQAIFEGASRDGRYVYFRTNSPLQVSDPNAGSATAASANSWDLYRYELPADLDDDPADGTLVRVSGGEDAEGDVNTNQAGTGAGAGAALRFLSADGNRAYFVTRRALPETAADNTPPDGSSASNLADTSVAVNQNTLRHLYLFDASDPGSPQWKFVANLPAAFGTGSLNGCATSASGSGSPMGIIESGAGNQGPVRNSSGNCIHGSPDGRGIVFETGGQLTADDVDSAGDIYFYDADDHQLSRVSAPRAGQDPYVCDVNTNVTCNADLGFGLGLTRLGLDGLKHANIAIDAGGDVKAVYFETRLQLIAADVNDDRYDTYQWTPDGRLSLISPGSADADSWYSGNSLDGEDVFFFTRQRISPWEIDDADFDLYDARVGDGLPNPPAPPLGCDVLGDGCQGGSTGAPADDRPASSELEGEGNVKSGSDCLDLEARLERTTNAAARVQSRARKAAAKAGKASGKKAKRLKKQAKKLKKRTKQASNKARQVERKLEDCRSSK